MFRHPAVAGAFYPNDKAWIKKFISSAIDDAVLQVDASKAISFVAPHAGYIYSGKTAAYTYKALKTALLHRRIDTFVIIGPNHTGYGKPIAVSSMDWETPLGIVKNDNALSNEIAKHEFITIDEEAHEYEHSIEVQLPFLQMVANEPKCVFICMGDQSLEASKVLSNAIIDASNALGRRIAVIASSDFNHYESAKIAEKKDLPAIEHLKKLDYIGFNASIEASGDTACGYGPITVATIIAIEEKAKEGILLKYSNSGDETKDYSSVVAYASIIFTS
ncbi:MAG: MEMO1 family protein [Candidatus Micrarchaeaceae archaeon]